MRQAICSGVEIHQKSNFAAKLKSLSSLKIQKSTVTTVGRMVEEDIT